MVSLRIHNLELLYVCMPHREKEWRESGEAGDGCGRWILDD